MKARARGRLRLCTSTGVLQGLAHPMATSSVVVMLLLLLLVGCQPASAQIRGLRVAAYVPDYRFGLDWASCE